MSACLAGTWACTAAGDKAPYVQLEGQAQGTTFSIQYADSLGRAWDREVDSLFRLLDQSMSLWDSTSLISRLNRGETDSVTDPHFIRVFDAAQAVSAHTQGAFDITIGPLINAWGFGADKSRTEPSDKLIDSLQAMCGYGYVRIDSQRLIRDIPGIHLDLNALAQGYSVDVISEFLETKGIRHYLVEIGGEVRASGVSERGEPWRIGIDKPIEASDSRSRELQMAIPLSGRALATSGSYRKFREAGGQRRHHIIDPRTGYPVSHKLISVSVVAADAMTADAWSTALMVMGLETGLPLATAQGLEVFGIYQETDGSLSTRITDGFPR